MLIYQILFIPECVQTRSELSSFEETEADE